MQVRGGSDSACRSFSWVVERTSRRQRMCSPKVRGSKSQGFRINDLSRTRTYGKKATPLCPCGWAGDPSGRCRCHPEAIQRYRGKISGPLLERIDLHVEVPRLPPAELRPDAPPGECSDVVRARIIRAREVQKQRAGRCNAHLDQSDTNAVCRLASEDQAMLENAIDLLQLSARSMHRILRVARTIADPAGSAGILGPHVAEAIGYRRGERAVPSRAA